MLPKLKPIDQKTFESNAILASDMAEWVKAFDSKRAQIVPRWDRIDKQLEGKADIPRDLPWDGFSYRNIPMLQAKANQWMAYVCNAPTSTTPYLIGTIFSKNAARAKAVEQDFYMFMRKAEWSRYFKQVTYSMGAYGKGIWRLTVDDGNDGRIGFKYECVPMRRFFVYPDVPAGIESARACGHTFELMYSTVKAMQADGQLWDGIEVSGTTNLRDNPNPVNVLDNKKSIAKRPQDYSVRLAEVFWKHRQPGDDQPKWYRAWITLENPQILAIWPYQYSRPWYFQQFLHEAEDSFLLETSRFGEGQDLQLALNEIWNTYSAAAMAGAFPTTFLQGWAVNQKYGKSKPGQMIPVSSTGQIHQLQSRFDSSSLHDIIEGIYRKCSEIFRLDEQAQGVRTSSDQTATAAQIRQGGTQVAITDDLANIDICMGQMGIFQQELYKVHYQEFLEDYGEDLAVQPDETTDEMGFPEILDKPIIWELQGKSPSNTPIAQSQQSMQLYQELVTLTNPETVQVLIALGINVAGLIQTTVTNSSIANNNVLLINPAYSAEDPQVQMQAMEEMFQKIAQMRQQKPQPKPPMESISFAYDRLPPTEAAQVAQQYLGIQPDPAHAQGLPSVGSEQWKEMMEVMATIKGHGLEREKAEKETARTAEESMRAEQEAQRARDAEDQGKMQESLFKQRELDQRDKELEIQEMQSQQPPTQPE